MTLPHYDVHDGNGPPLLLVHGFLSSRAQWALNLESLKTHCSPVVVELFGHGRSQSPDDVSCYHPDYYVQVFEEIRLKLNVKKWYVLGYSLGAGLTLRYALSKPEAVIAQIFTNSTSAFADPALNKKLRDKGDELISLYQKNGKKSVESIPVHPKNAKFLPDEVKIPLLQDCQLLDPIGVVKTIVHTNGNSSVRDLAHKNIVPTLLINGENEKRFMPFKNFAIEHLPELKVKNLPAGHAVNIECASEFNQVVKAFLTHQDNSKPA